MTPEVAIVGAGYVGLPLAQVFAEAGVPVVLVDVDATRVEAINRGESYVEDVPSSTLAPLVDAGTLMELLRAEGADVSYHDPHIPDLPAHGLRSQDLDGAVSRADCVAIVTAHSTIDYKSLADRAGVVDDFRNAVGTDGSSNGRVWKL